MSFEGRRHLELFFIICDELYRVGQELVEIYDAIEKFGDGLTNFLVFGYVSFAAIHLLVPLSKRLASLSALLAVF